MATLLSGVLSSSPPGANNPELTALEALSGISGSISLVSWIVLLLPQLIENYKNSSADALSLSFLIAWFVGDLTSLIGAIWGGLLPTVIAIAIYFCFADVTLLLQKIYYNRVAQKEKEIPGSITCTGNSNDQTQPLINRRRSSGAMSWRRRNSLPVVLSRDTTLFIRNTLLIVGVCVAGTLGWAFAWLTGTWQVQVEDPTKPDMPFGAEILGYASAVLYLTARIPQILRNHKKKSCEGLSLLFFCLSLLGNLSYGAGILFHSTEGSYVLNNLPWLIGSLGTMVEDIIIFVQFHKYSNPPTEDVEEGINGERIV